MKFLEEMDWVVEDALQLFFTIGHDGHLGND